MGWRPHIAIRRCPACGQSSQTLDFRHIFSCDVRLECQCGVAGQWRTWSPEDRADPWHDAADGWSAVFGEPERPPPPVALRFRTPPSTEPV